MWGYYQLPDETLVQANFAVDKFMAETSTVPHDHMIKDQLRQHIANEIANKKVEVVDREYIREYRLRLYVLTGDELMQLVRKEAQRYYMQQEPNFASYNRC